MRVQPPLLSPMSTSGREGYRTTPKNQRAPPMYMASITSTAGWGQVDPQEQASAAAVSWSAGETAPRLLDASATTRSLFGGLAIHG